MMWIRECSRREFIDLMQVPSSEHEGTTLFRSEPDRDRRNYSDLPFSHAELQLLWPESEGASSRFPRVVVVNEGKVQDFLAWVATYFPNHRPFTAYCRVVERSNAESSLSLFRKPTLGRLEDSCAGIILGETASYLDTRQELRSLSSKAAESTYSFCMSRALALGIAGTSFGMVTEGWTEARQLTRQPRLNTDVVPMQPVWAAMFQLANGGRGERIEALPDELMEILVELMERGEIQSYSLDRLTRHVSLSSVYREMDGPREQRVQLLNRVLAELASGEFGNDEVSGFLAGLLTAYVGPGTLDYTGLLRPHMQRLPSALVWYGLIAGLQSSSSVQSFGMGLGRRIVRDVLRNEEFLDLPTCDIAIAELSVFSRATAFDFRTASRSHLEIEIAPCVNVTLRLNTSADSQAEMFPLSGELNSELLKLDSDIDFLLGRLESMQTRVQTITGKRRYSDDRKSRRKPSR
jgi:hypothetical protein